MTLSIFILKTWPFLAAFCPIGFLWWHTELQVVSMNSFPLPQIFPECCCSWWLMQLLLLYNQKLSGKPACWDLDFWQRGKNLKVGTAFFKNLWVVKQIGSERHPPFFFPCEDYLWTQEQTQSVDPSGAKTQTGFSMLTHPCAGRADHAHGCHLSPGAAFSWRAFCGNSHLKRSSCLLLLTHWGFSLDQFSVGVQHLAL